MFLRNCWYMADWARSIAAEQVIQVTILDEPIALYRTKSGAVVALEDRCAHRLAPLSIGRVEGEDLRCMYHGVKFAPDGRCNEIPGQERISSKVCVRGYPVVERHGCIWIWMGRAERADATLIPNVIGPDNAEWAVLTSHLDFAANAGLIADNLLDLSHAPWVHGATFGAGSAATAAVMKAGELATTVTQLERGLKFERWHIGRPSNPYVEIGPTDDFVTNEFLAPGVFILVTRSYKPGVRARSYLAETPAEEPVLMRSTCQMITPVSERKSKFFFTFGPWAPCALHAQKFFDVAEKAFLEDKFFIESQQLMMDRSPERKVINLAMDVSLQRYHGILRGLIEEDRKILQGV